MTTFLSYAGTREFVNEDLTNPALQSLTSRYLDFYTGLNTFIRNMRQFRARYHNLTPAQWRAVANIALADERHTVEIEQAELVPDAQDLEAEVRSMVIVLADTSVQSGYYTVGERGAHTTIRLTKIRADGRRGHLAADGVMTAGVLVGHNNETSYDAFALVWPDGRIKALRYGQLKANLALTAVLKMTSQERDGAGREYARVSGRCLRCGRLLTDPLSIDTGRGAECAGGVAAQRRILAKIKAAV